MSARSWPLHAAAVTLLALASACADTRPTVAPSGAKIAVGGKDDQPRSCFFNRDVTNWTDVDRSTINIRVNLHDYYQIKLFAPCGDIDFSQRIGLRSRGSDYICSGLDVEILAPSPIGRQSCPATSIHKLTAEEVAALPPKQKP
jgi:hypothetical protein